MRAVIFSDVPSNTSIELSRATLNASKDSADFSVCGFVTSVDRPPKPVHKRLRSSARKLVEAATGGPWPSTWNTNLQHLADRADLPCLVANDGVNSPQFIDRLHDELRPDVMLSYFAVSIFKPALLDSVGQAVNYHDGLLPEYAGLAATSHSIHQGEKRSGYTFHRITPGIDEGPILLQGDVPIAETDTLRSVNRAKVAAAVADVPQMLEMVKTGDPGHEQSGPGSYFNHAAYTELTVIDEPARLSAAEIMLRLRAFGTLEIRIGNEREFVTDVTTTDDPSAWSFQTSDGQTLRASRVAGLPAALISARRRLRRAS